MRTSRDLMRSRGGAPAWLRLVAVLAISAVALMGLAATATAKSGTVWLCRPGLNPDPCKADRTSTVVSYTGTTREEAVQKPVKDGAPPVDCFYVYPTVSEQAGPNANLEIEPQEKQIAIDQASRFSQDCHVYAPMYPQLTLKAIDNPEGISTEDALKAYGGVPGAWLEYLAQVQQGPRRSC